MKTTLVIAASLALASAGAWADTEAAMRKANCTACHAKDAKLLGPSFKDIAAKYKGQDVTARLIEKVRKGGSGSFGQVPMPPNPPDQIGDADLKDAVELILKS